jgi:spermidine synthase
MTGRRLPIALAALGLASTIAQVLLLREVVATFYGNELLLGLALAAWLAWTAAGSWGLGRTAAVRRLGERGFAAGLVLAAALLPSQIALVRGARALLGITPGTLAGLGPAAGTVVVVLGPLCLLSGALFALGARLAAEGGISPGRAYVWESVGAVLGGALYSLLLVNRLDPFQVAFLIGAANLTVALAMLVKTGRASHRLSSRVAESDGDQSPPVSPLLRPCSGRARSRGGEGSAPGEVGGEAARGLGIGPRLFPTFALLVIGALLAGPPLHAATLARQWPDLAFAADSAYGRITVQARDGQRIFYQNGLLAFETQGTFPEEVVHFPLLAHADPRRVLLVGGGAAGDAREILKHPTAGVTYVEIDPLLIEAAEAYLPREDADVLDDPRVTLALEDGRVYVQAAGHTFDVVILDLPEPSTGALNRFYTSEFFAEVHAVLDPDGILALGLPAAENYVSPEMARRNGSVYLTLRETFPEVVALPGEHVFFLASDVPPETDPAVLAARLAERGVETRWVTPGYLEYVLAGDRFTELQQGMAAMAGVRANRDLAPICYYYDLALWLSRLYPPTEAGRVPPLRKVFERAGAAEPSLWYAALGLAPLVGLARWRRRWAVPFAIACAGLAEMALEVVILFAFQTLHGTVFARVSLVVTGFMGGLALGGTAGNRLLARRRGAPRRALLGILGAVAAYGALLPIVLSLPLPVPPVAFPLLALVAGGLPGMAFPLALASAGPGTEAAAVGKTGRVAGLLYGADLVGGCLGALASSVLLVPLLGIPQTCAVVALVGLAGLVALV